MYLYLRLAHFCCQSHFNLQGYLIAHFLAHTLTKYPWGPSLPGRPDNRTPMLNLAPCSLSLARSLRGGLDFTTSLRAEPVGEWARA